MAELPSRRRMAAGFLSRRRMILGGGLAAAAVPVTATEGRGYLVVRPEDLSGEQPWPSTSNVNWSSTGQTLANLTFSAVGGEHAIEVRCDGGGSTHVICDVQGYLPFVAT
jgi:hypothetical protein